MRDQRCLRVGRLRFQRVRTAHRAVPLVHDLTANNADGIVLCTRRTVGNGNIVDRAAPGALKFIDGTLPRLIRHHATMRRQRTHARLNTVQWVCALRVSRVVGTSSEERCRIVLWNPGSVARLKRHARICWRSKTEQSKAGSSDGHDEPLLSET
jgi:hypothetical protein